MRAAKSAAGWRAGRDPRRQRRCASPGSRSSFRGRAGTRRSGDLRAHHAPCDRRPTGARPQPGPAHRSPRPTDRLCDRRQGLELEHVPVARGGQILRQPFGFGSQRIELLDRPPNASDPAPTAAGAARRAADGSFRIAAILGRRQRLKQMEEAGTQDRREGLVERHRRIEAKFSRAPRRGGFRRQDRSRAPIWCGSTALRRRAPLAATRSVDRARAAALEFKFDLAHPCERSPAVTRPGRRRSRPFLTAARSAARADGHRR